MNDLMTAAKPLTVPATFRMEAAMNQVLEMASALSAGDITPEQFDYVTEAIRQLKFLALSKAAQEATP